MDKIRILIVDDHAVLREGMRQLLSKEDDLEVVGMAGDGIEAVRRSEPGKGTVVEAEVVVA